MCVLLVLAACEPPPLKMVDAAPDPSTLEVVATFPSSPRPLDLMLVIDDSPSMYDKQVALASTFPQLLAKLESFDGGLPDLQIAVVSSDMGTSASADASPGPAIGAIGNGGCSGRGKAGAFVVQQNVLRSTTTQKFLAHPRGGEPNYNGTLESALSTQVRLGAGGCGFEQPLAAMKASFEHPMNTGFVRPEASLAVVILSDEDDCSARTAVLFGLESAALGPQQSFRCFRFGVECSPDTVNEVGTKTACRPRQAPEALVDNIAPYGDAVLAAKGNDPRKVMLGAIIGPPDVVAVETRNPPNGGAPQIALARACAYTNAMGAAAVADPAVRLAALVDGFSGLHVRETICGPELGAAARSIGLELERLIVGDRCLYSAITDDDRCIVADQTGDEAPVAIEKCGGGAATPCYRIMSAPCSSGARLEIARTEPPPPNTFTTMRCSR